MRILDQFQQLKVTLLDLIFGKLRKLFLYQFPVLSRLFWKIYHDFIVSREKLLNRRFEVNKIIHVSLSNTSRSSIWKISFWNHCPILSYFFHSFDQYWVLLIGEFSRVLKLVAFALPLFVCEWVNLHFYIFPILSSEKIRSCAFTLTRLQSKRSLVESTCHRLNSRLCSWSYIN